MLNRYFEEERYHDALPVIVEITKIIETNIGENEICFGNCQSVCESTCQSIVEVTPGDDEDG